MEEIARHTYQILTKRPERMRRYVKHRYSAGSAPKHLWFGTSIENNAYAWRATMLREIDAAVLFLSVEPMLGPVDQVDFTRISQVIVGGESGPGRRPLDPQWVRDVRDRCTRDGIAFFFKQMAQGHNRTRT